VGDEDQSIYNFRGADLRNILDFEKDFPQARLIKLERNYRSTTAILETASALIQHNRARKGKRLLPQLGAGERPRVHAAPSDIAECHFVANQIESLRKESSSIRVAVLFRTHAQTRVFEEEFVRRNIPHLLVGGQRFYERREVKDALAYLRLVANPHDNASFLRAINTPPRGFGAATLAQTERTATEQGISLWDAAGLLADDNAIPARASQGLAAFRELRDALAANAAKMTLAALVDETVRRSGLYAMLKKEDTLEAEARLENLSQIVTAASEYQEREDEPTLPGFLDTVSLLTDLDTVREDAPCLLMTLHSAKGLEFDAVFLSGMEEGLFPHFRSVGDRKSTEEERRLCYVGMTRARSLLFLTYARSRRSALEREGRMPSRFLNEIPPELLDREAVEPPPDSAGTYARGVRVRHPLFGEGTVVEADAAGRNQKVTVLFQKAGRKKLATRFAGLETVSGPRPTSAARRSTRRPHLDKHNP
jgi:DNA helicase-2/ATP-dependent DNA helicase PcrA